MEAKIRWLSTDGRQKVRAVSDGEFLLPVCVLLFVYQLPPLLTAMQAVASTTTNREFVVLLIVVAS
jgi:hypothetical protein